MYESAQTSDVDEQEVDLSSVPSPNDESCPSPDITSVSSTDATVLMDNTSVR